MVSAHQAPTVTMCICSCLPCQPAQSTEKQMFPRQLCLCILVLAGCRRLAILCGCRLTSGDCRLLPLLESVDHTGAHWPSVAPCPTATSTAVEVASCLRKLLCTCTVAFTAAAQTRNGAHPFSAGHWVLL